MTAVWALVLLALAIICWPAAAAELAIDETSAQPSRLRWLKVGHRVGPRSGAGTRLPTPSLMRPWSAAGLVGGVAGVVVGPAVGVAAAMAAGTVTRLIAVGTRSRSVSELRVQTVDAVRVLGRELRAGSPVGTACEAAAGSAGPAASGLFAELAVAARVGSDSITTGMPHAVTSTSALRDTAATAGVRHRLQAAWFLSRKYGIPLAALVDGAALGLAREAEAAGRQASLLAGPRLSGYLLSGLPLLGVVLGLGMGANPIPVLFGDGVGSLLLVAGVLLTCLGLLWSARIARN